MSDKMLSQQEIEALLSGMAPEEPAAASAEDAAPVSSPTAAAAGETEPAVPLEAAVPVAAASHAAAAAPRATARQAAPSKPVKLYDFRRPDKFSKDHLRALRILHVGFARMVSSSLSSYLRTSAQVRLTMVEETSYDEYIRSLPSPTVMYVCSPDPLPGQIVVELNLNVARAMLDRLLGGTGVSAARAGDMTEIEVQLLRTLGNFLMSSLRDTWASVAPVEPTFQEPQLSPEFVQATLLTESTCTLVFEISVLQESGTISICLPHPTLQPVLDSITSQVWSSGTSHQVTDDVPVAGRDQLAPVALPVAVELGRAELSLRDLLGIQAGQVLRLDTPASGELVVRVGDGVKFLGRAGTTGSGIAVQLTRVLG